MSTFSAYIGNRKLAKGDIIKSFRGEEFVFQDAGFFGHRGPRVLVSLDGDERMYFASVFDIEIMENGTA